MLPSARLGIDIAISPLGTLPNIGIAITGSILTDIETIPAVRITDITQNVLPLDPVGIVITGSTLTDTETLPMTRLGDIVQNLFGIMVFITGSVVVDSA